MNDGGRFALGLVILFLAMVAFFFALHPTGLKFGGKDISNPVEAIKYLMDEFNNPGQTPGGSG